MRTLFDQALVGIDRQLGWGTARERVKRIELGRDGALLATLETPEGTLWFRCAGEELSRLDPARDERLPLCGARAREIADGALQVLSWRPGRRIVLAETRGGEALVLKGFRRGRSAAAAARARAVQAAAERAEGLLAPSLVEHEREQETLAFARIEGAELGVHPIEADSFSRVGEALAALRSAVVEIDLPEFTLQDELEVLGTSRARVETIRGVPPGWDEVFHDLPTADALPAGPPVPTHRDLHDRQLLLTDGGVAILDFDLLCVAAPALDLGNLTAHLQLRALQGVDGATQRGADDCARALLGGLEAAGASALGHDLRAYQATTFLRLALLYSIRPRWVHLVQPLIDLARRAAHDTASQRS